MPETMPHGASTILIVESSPVQAKIVSRHIEDCTGFSTLHCTTLEEVRKLVREHRDDIFLSVCNLNLKDAPNGEAVDHVLSQSIACIVLTTTFNEDIRNRFLEKNVLDYLNKSDVSNLEKLVGMVDRIHSNSRIKVLLVEDNATARAIMKKLLVNQNYTVIEAEDGPAALETMKTDPSISLVISDYEMPGMDGVELVTAIRRDHPSDRLAIIGVSSHNSGALTAKFLTSGANDFLKKPFEVEEFYCRVNKNVGELERTAALRIVDRKDPLTGLSNFRHFVRFGREAFGPDKSLGVLRLDNLLDLAAEYGYDAVDAALKNVGALAAVESADMDALCRKNDCFLLMGSGDGGDMSARLSFLADTLDKNPLQVEGEDIRLPVSTGVAHQVSMTFDGSLVLLERAMAKAASPSSRITA